MRDISHILVPTDFSTCSQHATANALALAKHFGAKVTLLHASLLYEHDASEQERFELSHEVLKQLDDHVGERMGEHLDPHDLEGIDVEKVQIRGITATSAILNYARERDFDLIVMGTHGRTGFKRWLLGSVAEEIVRMAPAPVVSVKEAWKKGDLGSLKRILVPLDFSLASETALAEAFYMAKSFNASLDVVHIIQAPAYSDVYGATMLSPEEFYAAAETKAKQTIADLVADAPDGMEAHIHVLKGHPAKEVVKFAEEHGNDLILISHLGLSRLPNRIFGSVTEHVVRAAACPVLTADLGSEKKR